MSFDQSLIIAVNPPKQRAGDIELSWQSDAPAGTTYQVYLDRRRVWSSTATRCYLSNPGRQVQIDVGTVGTGEAQTDFSASLPAAPANRVTLTWTGGTFLDSLGDVACFKIFGSSSPAGYGTGGYGAGGYGVGQSTINYARPLAVIPAYTAGATTDGYGFGGYGAGGYGRASASYSWQSDPLWTGTWTFAVAACNAAGAIGTLTTASESIQVPPRCPGATQAGSRLNYTLDGYGVGPYGGGGYGSGGYGSLGYGYGVPYGGCVAVLSWLPTPG